MTKKIKILLVLHLPPPVHGAAMVGKIIKESQQFNTLFDGTYINLSTSRTLTEIGKQSFSKTWSFITLCFNVFWKGLTGKYKLCYLTINSKGTGFYKDFVFVLMLRLLGKKLVYHFHNKGTADFHHRTFDHILYKIAFRKAKVILLSPYLYPDIRKYVPEDRVYYCANGLPSDTKITSATAKENVIPHLLFLSNMMEAKGVFDLLEACAILKRKGYPFVCDFVGKWSDITAELFNQKVSHLSVSDVIKYHGAKFDDDKTSIIQQSELFILPTHNDCFPLVVLEAMQYGLPVIASAEGAIPEIVDDNETGLLVQKKNPADLAAKIEILLNNRELGKQMGAAGRKKFEEQYTLEVFETNFCNIMTAICNKI